MHYLHLIEVSIFVLLVVVPLQGKILYDSVSNFRSTKYITKNYYTPTMCKSEIVKSHLETIPKSFANKLYSSVKHNTISRQKRSENKSRKHVRSVSGIKTEEITHATVETLVIFDHALHNHFKENSTAIQNYATLFFRGINNRFWKLKDPKITFVISGVISMPSLAAQNKFLRESKYNNDALKIYDADKTHRLFGDWIYNQAKEDKTFPHSDIAILIMKGELQFMTGSFNPEDQVLGLSWQSQACDWLLKVAVVYDQGDFGGVFSATHELAHLLGAVHNGEGSARLCGFNEGFIMGEGGGRIQQYFSECSTRAMKSLILSDSGQCLRSFQNENHLPIYGKNIGEEKTLNEWCQLYTNVSSAVVYHHENITASDLCNNIRCSYLTNDINGNMSVVEIGPAWEGTACGVGGTCWWGKCLSKIERLFLRS